ncbi:HEAT repeat domain-containing protein [Lentzea sp. NPDC051213]|uniref:HEAT repeat domain-containing protein n=1 Tax=Lentzea sp. NPDC051213 TaxID=3364126 RepID=UPI0037B86B3D
MSQDLAPAVDNVPWDRLHHHFGTAEDIPDLLLRCATDSRAFGELHNKIYHQGGCIVSAAPPVMPVLVRWAQDPAAKPRPAAIALVSDLAAAAREARPEHVPPGWHAAWDAAVPQLVALMSDPDPVVRRRVASALAQAYEHTDLVLPALHARWQQETDEPARLCLVSAASQLLRDMVGEWPSAVVDWLSGLSRHPDPAHRFAGVLALRRSGLGGRDPRHIDEAASYLDTADLSVWKDVLGARRTSARLITTTDDLLRADRDGRTRLAAAMLRQNDADKRSTGLKTALTVMSRWRSPVATLLPLVAVHLSDSNPEQRRQVASILATTGSASLSWRDALLEACADEVPAVARTALHALVSAGAPEAVDVVADLLSTPDHGVCGEGGCREPSIAKILEPLRTAAAELLPVVRQRLGASTTLHEQRAYLQVLTAWGTAAAEAVGDIAELLGTEAEEWALDALVALDSVQARDAVLTVIDGAQHGQSKSTEIRTAIRRWQVTGDATALLHRLRTADPTLRKHVHVLADVGPAAADAADQLRRLAERERPGWERARIQHALWTITGDSVDAVASAAAVRRALRSEGYVYGYGIGLIGNLVRMGPLAQIALPALRPLLNTDVRPVQWDRRHAIPEDDLLCRSISEVLAAAE